MAAPAPLAGRGPGPLPASGLTLSGALVSGVGALAVLVLVFDAPFALVAMGGLAVLLVLVHRPELAVVLVAFLLYSNVAVVAHQMHGVPRALAGSFVLLLGIPLAHHLLLRRERLRADPVFRLMLVFLCVMLASSLAAPDKAIALQRIQGYAFEGLLVYWLVVNVIRSEGTLRRALWATLAAGALVAGLSVYQAATGAHDRDFGGLAQRSERVRYLSSEDGGDERVAVVTVSYRAGGPMGEPNRYAQTLIVLLPIALVLGRHAGSRRVRWCAGIAGALVLAGIVLSYSRGALLALVLLVVVLAALRWIRPGQLLAGAVCLAALSPVLAPRLMERVASLGAATALVVDRPNVQADGAIRGRATEMAAAAAVTADHPVLGVGPGQYAPVFSEAYHQSILLRFRDLPRPRRAHNLYLEMAAETGLVGLIAFLAIFGVLLNRLRAARARWRARAPFASDLAMAFVLSVGVYLVTAMFLHLAFERYLWFLLALAAAAVHVQDAGSGRGTAPGEEDPWYPSPFERQAMPIDPR